MRQLGEDPRASGWIDQGRSRHFEVTNCGLKRRSGLRRAPLPASSHARGNVRMTRRKSAPAVLRLPPWFWGVGASTRRQGTRGINQSTPCVQQRPEPTACAPNPVWVALAQRDPDANHPKRAPVRAVAQRRATDRKARSAAASIARDSINARLIPPEDTTGEAKRRRTLCLNGNVRQAQAMSGQPRQGRATIRFPHMKEPVARKFMTIAEAAEALHVSTRTVRRLVDRGLLRTCSALRHVLIPTVDVDSFVTRTCPESRPGDTR